MRKPASKTRATVALAAVAAAVGAAAVAAVSSLSSGAASPAGRPAAGAGGPSVVRLWTFPAREQDTLYLGRPSEFSVDEDGTVYVADRFFGRVVRLARDGRILRTYGRKGRGPGEFVDLGQTFAAGGRLYVTDYSQGHVSILDKHTGAFVRNQPFQGILTHAVVQGPTIWLGLLNRSNGTSAARWRVDGGGLHYFGGLPRSYQESQPLAGIFTGSAVSAWADTIAVGLQGSNTLVLYLGTGQAVDTVVVPARARRGVPDDIVQRFEKLEFPEMFRAASFLMALQRLNTGELALVHFDQDIEGRAVTSTPYVSLVSADRRRACIDRHLPLTTDAQPHVYFRGDTLFTLEQRLTEQERPQTTVSAYLISGDGCSWERLR